MPGNPEFWSDVKKIGRNLSLISKAEARKQGGLSSVADDEAEEVRFFCEVPKQWMATDIFPRFSLFLE